jgi:hypothetical protein
MINFSISSLLFILLFSFKVARLFTVNLYRYSDDSFFLVSENIYTFRRLVFSRFGRETAS